MFGIDDAIAKVSGVVDTVVKRVWADATEVELAKINQATEQIKIELSSILGQLEINKEEAKHPSVFVAGWRPALGWVGAISLAYNFLFQPIMNGLLAVFGIPSAFVSTPTQEIMSLIGGMTGLVVSRSVDKYNGSDTKRVK